MQEKRPKMDQKGQNKTVDLARNMLTMCIFCEYSEIILFLLITRSSAWNQTHLSDENAFSFQTIDKCSKEPFPYFRFCDIKLDILLCYYIIPFWIPMIFQVYFSLANIENDKVMSKFGKQMCI